MNKVWPIFDIKVQAFVVIPLNRLKEMLTRGSQNIWLKNNDIKDKKKKEFSFRDDLYVFLNSTICHCYRHLAQVDRSNAERYCIRIWYRLKGMRTVFCYVFTPSILLSRYRVVNKIFLRGLKNFYSEIELC